MKNIIMIIVGLFLIFGLNSNVNSETMETTKKNIKIFCENRWSENSISNENRDNCIYKQFGSYMKMMQICDEIVWMKGRSCKEMQMINKILVENGAEFDKLPGGDRWINTDWEMTLYDVLRKLKTINSWVLNKI